MCSALKYSAVPSVFPTQQARTLVSFSEKCARNCFFLLEIL